jgi:hypothetical protein
VSVCDILDTLVWILQLFDEEGAGEISPAEMCAGFRRLGQALGNRMHVSLDDCLLFAEQASDIGSTTNCFRKGNCSLGNIGSDGAQAAAASTLDGDRFAGILKRALQQHVEKAIGRAMGACSPAGYERTLLAATRALMMSCRVQHLVDDLPGPSTAPAPANGGSLVSASSYRDPRSLDGAEATGDSCLRTPPMAGGGVKSDFRLCSPLSHLTTEAEIPFAIPEHEAVTATAGAMVRVDSEPPHSRVNARGESEQKPGESHPIHLANQGDAYNAGCSDNAAPDTGGSDLATQQMRQEMLAKTICQLREEITAAAARLAAVSHELHVAADWELPAVLSVPSTSDCGAFAFFDSDEQQSNALEQHAEAEGAFCNNAIVSGVDYGSLPPSGLRDILSASKLTGESSSQNCEMENEICKALANAESRSCVDQLEAAPVCYLESTSIPHDASECAADDTGRRLSCAGAAVLLSARSPSLKFCTTEASSYGLESSTLRDDGEGNDASIGTCKTSSKEAACDNASKVYGESVPEFSAANLRWSLVLGLDWKSVWPGLWEGAEREGRTMG